jgi:poly(3-hydroxybutyrate) depolymerase
MRTTSVRVLGSFALAVWLGACSSGGNGGSSGTAGNSQGTAGNTQGTGGNTQGTGGNTQGTGGTPGTGGDQGTAGSTGTGGSTGIGGTTGTGGSVAGSTGTGGQATGGTTGTAGAGTGGAAGGATGTGGTPAPAKSMGCTMPPGGGDSAMNFVEKDIMVNGVDAAFITAHPPNQTTFTWTKRNYFLRLPANYDPGTAYSLTLAGTGCGGSATVGSGGDYTLPQLATGAKTQPDALQIALSYVPSNSVNNCATFADGYTNSPEPMYINAVIDDVSAKYCVDKNKIFVNGYSSGAWEAILSGCNVPDKVRAFGVQIGGGERITKTPCTTKPVAAMFVVGLKDVGNPIGPLATPQNGSYGSVGARDALLKRNGCVAPDFQIVDTCSAEAAAAGSPCAAGIVNGDTFSNVPHTAWNATKYPKCQMYTGCPAKYPVVWCPLEVDHGNGPNPAGADGGAIVESYRRQGLWDFYSSLAPE